VGDYTDYHDNNSSAKNHQEKAKSDKLIDEEEAKTWNDCVKALREVSE